MSEGHKVKLTICSPVGSQVTIDGVKVKMLKNIRLTHNVESAPILSIDFYPEDIEVEIVGDIAVEKNPLRAGL